jgi:serine/threonine-protein kinase
VNEQTRQTLEIARSLQQRGQVDAAVGAFLRAQAFEEAAQAYMAVERFADAGRLLMDSLNVGTALLAGLDPERKRLASNAAVCFAKAGDYKTSVAIYQGLGDSMRAADVLERAGDAAGAGRLRAMQGQPVSVVSAADPVNRNAARRLEQGGHLEEAMAAYLQLRQLRDAGRVAVALRRHIDAARIFLDAGMPYEAAVCFNNASETGQCLEALVMIPSNHPKYRVSCIKAVHMAKDLGSLDFRLDQFLSRFVAAGPMDAHEVEAFYLLAQLYKARDHMENARDLYQRILKVNPNYRDTAALLASIDAETRGSAMVYESIVREDASFRKAGHGSHDSHKQGERVEPKTGAKANVPHTLRIPDFPDLPPLPATGFSATVALSGQGHGVGPASEPSFPLDALPPGAIIAGRYRVERKLGQGGMAAVYEAMDSELGEAVAVKIFLQRTDEQMLSRFKQELSLSRQLNHPNIVRLYDIGTHQGYKFITMELLEGCDLGKCLEDGKPLELGRGLRYMIQACEGLSLAHEKGIIHRDIKPENFFITKADTLRIMDFGIAKGKASAGLTVVGFVAGTPAYMSPEQINDFGAVTHLSDIYSLGVLAFEVFTGTLPFWSDAVMSLLVAHLSEAPPSPRSRNPEIPRELEDIILRLLEKEPSKRIASCRDLATYLGELAPRPARGFLRR